MMLCLDLGTKTGWAMRVNGSVISGVQDFTPRRFDGGGMRYLRFSNWLSEVWQSQPFNLVYFEEVRRHMGVDAAHAYGGFLAHLSAFCERNEIPYEGIPVATIKKSVTGKGNSNKQAVVDAVRAMGYEPVDDNHADALAILHWSEHGRVEVKLQ